MEKDDFFVSPKRYNWVNVVKYVQERLDAGVAEDEVSKEISGFIGGNGGKTVRWAKKFLEAKTRDEAIGVFGQKTQEDEALKEFFPDWYVAPPPKPKKVPKKAKAKKSKAVPSPPPAD